MRTGCSSGFCYIFLIFAIISLTFSTTALAAVPDKVLTITAREVLGASGRIYQSTTLSVEMVRSLYPHQYRAGQNMIFIYDRWQKKGALFGSNGHLVSRVDFSRLLDREIDSVAWADWDYSNRPVLLVGSKHSNNEKGRIVAWRYGNIIDLQTGNLSNVVSPVVIREGENPGDKIGGTILVRPTLSYRGALVSVEGRDSVYFMSSDSNFSWRLFASGAAGFGKSMALVRPDDDCHFMGEILGVLDDAGMLYTYETHSWHQQYAPQNVRRTGYRGTLKLAPFGVDFVFTPFQRAHCEDFLITDSDPDPVNGNSVLRAFASFDTNNSLEYRTMKTAFQNYGALQVEGIKHYGDNWRFYEHGIPAAAVLNDRAVTLFASRSGYRGSARTTSNVEATEIQCRGGCKDMASGRMLSPYWDALLVSEGYGEEAVVNYYSLGGVQSLGGAAHTRVSQDPGSFSYGGINLWYEFPDQSGNGTLIVTGPGLVNSNAQTVTINFTRATTPETGLNLGVPGSENLNYWFGGAGEFIVSSRFTINRSQPNQAEVRIPWNINDTFFRAGSSLASPGYTGITVQAIVQDILPGGAPYIAGSNALRFTSVPHTPPPF